MAAWAFQCLHRVTMPTIPTIAGQSFYNVSSEFRGSMQCTHVRCEILQASVQKSVDETMTGQLGFMIQCCPGRGTHVYSLLQRGNTLPSFHGFESHSTASSRSCPSNILSPAASADDNKQLHIPYIVALERRRLLRGR
jgi:hypothetical protein